MSSKRRREQRSYPRFMDWLEMSTRSATTSDDVSFQEFEQLVSNLRGRGVGEVGDIELRLETLDSETRSVGVIVSTSDPVPMFDFERMDVVDEVLTIEGFRSTDQVPLLNSHQRFDLDDVLGSIRQLQGNSRTQQVLGTAIFARLSTDDDEAQRIERIWQKVQQGHQRAISAGYRVDEAVYIEPGQTMEVAGRTYTAGERVMKIATRWFLREGSLVPIGADPRATTRSQQSTTQVETSTVKLREYLEKQGLRAEATQEELHKFWNELDDEKQRDADGFATPKEIRSFAAWMRDNCIRIESPESSDPPAPTSDDESSRTAERERVLAIRKECDGEHSEIEEEAIREGWDIEKVRGKLLEALRKARPTEESVSSGHIGIHSRSPQDEMSVEALQIGLMMKHGCRRVDSEQAWRSHAAIKLNVPQVLRQDVNNDDRQRAMEWGVRCSGLSLIDICREGLRLHLMNSRSSSQSIPVDTMDMIRMSVATLETSSIFNQSVGAMMLAQYEEAPDSTMGWTSETDNLNFLQNDRHAMGKVGPLKKRARGRNPDQASTDASVESYRVERYEQELTIDEMDIIDDRLGGLDQLTPGDMGAAARQVRPNLVYSELLANGNLSDGNPLFDASRNNTQAGVLDKANLQKAISGMQKQRIADRPLNIRARYLLVPPDIQWDGSELLRSGERRNNAASADYGTFNALSETAIALRVDDRLSTAGVYNNNTDSIIAGKDDQFFLAAAPGENGAKTIEVGYLAGSGRAPRVVFSRSGNQLLYTWTVTMDVGVKALDGRALFRSTGA